MTVDHNHVLCHVNMWFPCECRYKIWFTNRKSGYTVGSSVQCCFSHMYGLMSTRMRCSSSWLPVGFRKGHRSLNALLKRLQGMYEQVHDEMIGCAFMFSCIHLIQQSCGLFYGICSVRFKPVCSLYLKGEVSDRNLLTALLKYSNVVSSIVLLYRQNIHRTDEVTQLCTEWQLFYTGVVFY